MNKFYSKRNLLSSLAWLLAFFAACMATKGIAFAILIPLLLFYWSQRKPESLLKVIFIATSSMGIGWTFFPHSLTMVVSQKILMLGSAVLLAGNVFGRRQASILTPLLSLMPYMIFISITSQYGWCPVISYLKIFLFTMMFFALYGCSVKVMSDHTDVRKFRILVLTFSIFVIFGSILVIPLPSISMMGAQEAIKSGTVSLFRGVMDHSQTLGIMCAMFGTILYADWVFSIQRKDWLYLALLFCGVLLIWKSSSRTAMSSFLAGIVFISYFAMSSRMVNLRLRQKIFVNGLLVTLLLTLATLAVPAMREKALGFVLKYNKDSTVLDSTTVLGSRQHKLDFALDNWRRSPYIGNGFQVSEEMHYIRINGIKDILSAPVEKSTWVYAILEEGGTIGLVLFCLFVVISLFLLIKRKAYIGAALFFEMMMINLGEFCFFAMTSGGGMLWSLVFVGLVFDHTRNRGDALHRQIVLQNMRRRH